MYAGPDAAAVSKSGTCTDRAGNPSAATTFPFKYDATNPTVGNPLPARPPDRAGWYNRPVGFAVQGTDAMSGIDSCPPQSYTGPDSATASFAGACLDKAGNRGTKSFTLKLRRDRAGDERDCRPLARLERLVQPTAHRQLLGHGCSLGDRFLLGAGELFGA